jgi:uncharacterized protein
MTIDRLFLDTAFIQALLNPRDDFHDRAKNLFPRVRSANKVWITEAVLVEVGNALSAFNRPGAVKFIQLCYSTENIQVVSISTELMMQALSLYNSRSDKAWGLTDCISFVVMQQHNLIDAMTSDRHFVQASFHALMLEAN